VEQRVEETIIEEKFEGALLRTKLSFGGAWRFFPLAWDVSTIGFKFVYPILRLIYSSFDSMGSRLVGIML
jgi:hypothetical protein